ncbi:MAG: GAF domain-containing protein, partial [Dehalococcoidia bacterium]
MNPQETLDAAARLACEILKGDIAAISLVDGEGFLTIRSHVGLPEDCVARWRVRAGDGPFGSVFTEGQPHIVSDRAYLEKLAPAVPLKGMLLVPLKSGKAIVGCFAVGYKKARKLTRRDLRLANLFASYAVIGIETEALLESERSARKRSDAMVNIVATPRPGLSLKTLLTELSRAVLKLSVGERCGIFVLSEDGRAVETILALGGDRPLRWHSGEEMALADLAPAKFLSALNDGNLQPIVEERVTRRGIVPERWRKHFKMKSVAAYPLACGRKAVGLMTVSSYDGYVSFPQEEVATLVAVAKQVAILIENTRLYERERRQRQRSDTLASMLTAASSTLSLRQVCDKVCEATVKLTAGDTVSIFLENEGERRFVPVTARGKGTLEELKAFRNPPPQGESSPGLASFLRMMSRRPKVFVVEDVEASPYSNTWWFKTFHLKSLAYYPLRAKGRMIGILSVAATRAKCKFSQEEIDTFTAASKQAAVIIENARLYEREQRQRQRSETLTRMLTAASSTLSLRQACVRVCETALDLTVGNNVSIFLFDEKKGVVPMASSGAGGPEKMKAFLEPPTEMISSSEMRAFSRALAKRRTPVVVESVDASPYTIKWWVDSFKLKSLAYYPLRVKGRAIGFICVAAMGEERKFPQEEIEILTAVAKQAAVLIENTRLYEWEQKQRNRSDTVAKMLAAASSTLSLRDVCAKVCETAIELTVGDTVSVFLQRDDSKNFIPITAIGKEGRKELEKFRNPPPEVQSSPGLSLFDRMLARRRKPYIVEDIATSHHADSWWMKSFHLKSIAYYPLRAKGKMIGFLCVAAAREKQKFSQDEIDTLAAVARQAAVVIENARLYEQQQQQQQRAESLVSVLTAAASSLSLKPVLAKLCQSVVDISVGDRVSIFLMAEDESHLEPVMSLGLEDPELWKRFRSPRPGFENAPESMKLFQSVTTMEDPIVWDDAKQSPVLEKWWLETFNIKSIAWYPLRVKDQTIGFLSVDAFRHPVHFAKGEIDTLAAIANQAAVVIENARVYEREQEQRRRSEALVDVLTTAASNLGLNKVLVKICQTAVDMSVADRCSIFMMDDEGRLAPKMSLGVEDPELWERFRSAQALAGTAATSADLRQFYGRLSEMEEPLVIEDAATSSLVPKWWLDAFQVKSIVHYPLRIKDRTIGLMDMDAFRQKVQFPKEEIATLAAIARQAAVVIENARLHEQLQEQAITDHLTGLFNHRHVHKRLEEEFARAERTNSVFAVMMTDVDKFKDINDTYGHLHGDEALRFISKRLRETVRGTDIVGRYGGDEFLVILPDTTREAAEEVAHRITTNLAETPFVVNNDQESSVTIGMSIGIACYPQDGTRLDELIMLADGALYDAKRMGGSRAMSASEFGATPSQSLGFGLLQGLLNAIAHKDPYTRRHCEDNVRYVDMVAGRMNLNAEETESLRKAALLHDVGKIAIPDQTLLKPGPLDSAEWQVMQQHVRFGEMIVKGIAQISDAIEPVATHHERY